MTPSSSEKVELLVIEATERIVNMCVDDSSLLAISNKNIMQLCKKTLKIQKFVTEAESSFSFIASNGTYCYVSDSKTEKVYRLSDLKLVASCTTTIPTSRVSKFCFEYRRIHFMSLFTDLRPTLAIFCHIGRNLQLLTTTNACREVTMKPFDCYYDKRRSRFIVGNESSLAEVIAIIS